MCTCPSRTPRSSATTSCGSLTASPVPRWQIAEDFGVRPSCLKWLARRRRRDEGIRPGDRSARSRPSCARPTSASGCWSRRTRCCAGRRRICRRRTCRENDVPARPRAGRRRHAGAGRGDVPGAQDRPPALLPVARRAGHRRRTDRAYRANALFDAHRDDPEFGYRFLVDEAARRRRGDGRADRLEDLLATTAGGASFGKKRGRNGKNAAARRSTTTWSQRATSPPTPAEPAVARPTSPNTDRRGQAVLCAVKDVYSNRIVGYSIDSRMKSRLAVAALEPPSPAAVEVAGCVLHTDRGSQFRIRKFVHALAPPRHGRIDGESRCRRRQRGHGELLRAAAEERPRPPCLGHPPGAADRDRHLDREDLPPPPQARRLGRLTPIEYETIMTTPATQAA